jgi:hypothetical protein
MTQNSSLHSLKKEHKTQLSSNMRTTHSQIATQKQNQENDGGFDSE